MITRDNAINLELSRRKLLAAAGIVGGAAVAASLCGSGTALAAPATPSSAVPPTTPPVAGLHLQFGTDAASEMVVSWHTLQPVGNPRVMLGTLDGQLDRVVAAKETSYTDAKSGQVVYAYHANVPFNAPTTDFPAAAPFPPDAHKSCTVQAFNAGRFRARSRPAGRWRQSMWEGRTAHPPGVLTDERG
jgi:hypothetical protein